MRSNIEEYLTQIDEITNNIMFLYNILIRMENEGQKNTKQYHNMLQCLNLAIQEEDDLYTFFALNVELAVEAYAHLFGHEKSSSSFEIIINQNEAEMILTRIGQKLKAIIEEEPQYFFRSLGDSDWETIADEDKFEGMYYLYEIFPTLENSANMRIAGFIEQVFAKEDNSQMQDYLLKTKYYLSFLNSALEKLYLANGFSKVPNNFDEETSIPGVNISEDTEIKVKNLRGLSLVFEASDALFSQTDNDYLDLDNYKKNMIYTIILRTGFLYLSNEIAAAAYYELLLSIDENDSPEKYQNARQIIEIIFKNLDTTLKDVNQDFNNNPKYD